MSVAKRVAYLRGLAEGLDIEQSSKEGRVLNEMISVLEDIAADLEEIQEDIVILDEELSDLDEELSVLDEDLENLEDFLVGDDCDCCHDEDDEPVFYEVRCPSCGNEITIDEDVLLLGEIECPKCKERLEFDPDGLDEEEE